MQYQHFQDEESAYSEHNLHKSNPDPSLEQNNSRGWDSVIINPNSQIFNNGDSARLKDISNASKSKRILTLSIQMGLNVQVVMYLLKNQDLSNPEDQILNNLLDEYNKHMSNKAFEEPSGILKRSEIILRTMDNELRRSSNAINNNNRNSNISNNSLRISISRKKTTKQLKKICVECPICYEEYNNENDIIKLLCGHFTCQNCFDDYLLNKINIAQIQQIQCPQEACNFQIKEGELVRFLKPNPDLLKKYYKFKNAQQIAKNPKLKWCIRPGCENVVQVIDSSTPHMKCSCGQEFCFKCNNPWHPGMECEDLIEKIYKNYVMGAEVKYCPSCQAVIEKNDGCNHMTCIQCNHQFCWICEKPYTSNHYSLLNLNGCPGLQFVNISKKASPWRRRCLWLKSLLLTIFIIILFITIGPIIGIVMAIIFPLQRFFFDRGYNCSDWRNFGKSAVAFVGLLLVGIVMSPLIIIVFSLIFFEKLIRRR